MSSGDRASTDVLSAVLSDEGVGSFTEQGPWVVDPAVLTWSTGIDELRTRTHEIVPGLVRRRLVPPARTAVVGASLGATATSWLVTAGRQRSEPQQRRRLAASLRATFERLGPTYLKLGQLIASAEGLLPIELVEEFKHCRDRVPPDDFVVVRTVLEQELGRPIEQVFAHVDPLPLAAASIAQVHNARLLSGEEVVVKVQRSGIRELVVQDLAAMSWLIPVLERLNAGLKIANLPAYAELLAETLMEELDFRLEAQNMLEIAAVLAKGDAGRPVVVPRPHPELVTQRMLVMERLDGLTIEHEEEMAAAGIDPGLVFRALMASFLEGAMIHGVFHGDLHGGNMLVLPDGKVGIFDFGITGRLSEKGRASLLGMMTANPLDDDIPELRFLADMGAFPPNADLEQMTRELVALGFTKTVAEALDPSQLSKHMQKLMKELVRRGARLPKELLLYFKGLLYLNGATAALAGDLNLLEELGGLFEKVLDVHPDENLTFDRTAFEENVRRSYGADASSLTHKELIELQAAQKRASKTS